MMLPRERKLKHKLISFPSASKAKTKMKVVPTKKTRLVTTLQDKNLEGE